MSASAIRRKSYKKAQEEPGLFSPVHWEGDGSRGGSNEVPAGKLQVMEKFFTPVQQTPEGKGGSDVAMWDCQCRQQWPESRSDRFSTLSSSSSTSASSASASWSSTTSLDKEAFLPPGSRFHSQSCVDVSGEGKAFRCGRQEDAAYEGEEPAGSFARLRKGQSKSADRLPHRQTPHVGPESPGSAEGVDRHLYKATSLERSLVFNERAEILAPRQPHQTGVPAPSKGILKNGALATTDRLRKAKSIETITVRPVGREASSALGPARPLQREKQPPNTLDLSTPKKLPGTERMKLVEEKLRFSEFLNEITRQVLSPSSLSSLGWKPPEATSIFAGRTPGSSDGSEPKGSGSKASSPGSFLETAEGKAEEKASHGRRRPGQPEAHHNQHQARPAPARTVSPELSPLPNLGSLPKQPTEAAQGQRKPGEGPAGTAREAEGPELPPKKAEQAMAEAAEQSGAQEQRVSAQGEPGCPPLASFPTSLHGHDIGKPCSDPARCPVRVRVVVNPLPSPLPLPSLQASCCAPSPSVLRTSNLLTVWFLFKPSIEVPLSVFSPGTAVGAEPGATGVSSSLQQPCCWATLAGVDSHAGDPGRVRVRLGSALPLSQPSTPYTTGLNACSQVISTLPKNFSAPIRKGFPTEMNGGWTPQWRNIHLCTLFFPQGAA